MRFNRFMAKHALTDQRAPLEVPGPSPEVEAERRRTLRIYKAWTTGLLVVAAVIFLACTWWMLSLIHI